MRLVYFRDLKLMELIKMDEKKYFCNIYMYVKYCGIIKYMWWLIFVDC